ncbi:putative kinase, aminoglycoside phosphotransferase (APT) family [Nocardia amikacinitolerans]|uniref:phosphotransferase family protein n=1 Tax=Nocardia amikacinitolerans TaxID=756689 RepID=UPI00082F3007|nr:phosphotransferase family protein [Nocardia amikacinitolerans]MCP2317707.1 putative kinase, aminoglycoside phosphotransferase (APT) family [Nocardia amikacinitolerans]
MTCAIVNPTFGVPGVELSALAGWMDLQNLEHGPLTELRSIGGGTQNIMLRFTRGTREFVLRRGPLHPRATTNDNLRREMRLLAALAGTAVPHARLIAACPDESVLGESVFYLMEPLDGFNAAVELPALHASNADIRYRMGFALVDALATLSTADYKQAGLADFGRPDGFLERQVPRWLQELDSYAQLDNYPGHGLPVELVSEWLTRNRPTSGPIGLMHGDYHIANVMFAPDGPHVAAIVDWEMCTIGDPMLDLGWLLATWSEPDRSDDVLSSALARAGGLPSAQELVRRYGERTGFDVSAADWYAVLACFKLGIILEGTYARSCAGLAPADIGQRLHDSAATLFARARNLIDHH